MDVNCTDERERTPLMLLCRHNQSESLYTCVDMLLHRRDIDVNQQTDKDKIRNSLMLLSQHSRSKKMFEVAQLLIVAGIDLKQTNEYGRNDLMHLCFGSKSGKIVDVAQLIIDKGIDVHQTDKFGKNAKKTCNGRLVR